MEQKEINKLSILYFLLVIVACETRFHSPHQNLDILQDGFGGATIAGFPAVLFPDRLKNPVGERLPTNVPYNKAQYNRWNLNERYSNQQLINTEHSDKYRNLQASRAPEINPCTSKVTPSRQYIMSAYPARIYEKVNHGRDSTLYDKSFIKDVVDSRYRLYDAPETVRPDHNKAYNYYRIPTEKFKKPNEKEDMRPTRHGGTSFWNNYKKKFATKKPNRIGYLVFRYIRDNSSGRERGDLISQDNLTQNDNNYYGDPHDYYAIDVKKRFIPDYNYFL